MSRTSDKRIFSEEFFSAGLEQFPKVCQNCSKVYFDYSDWFAVNTLGLPIVFKRTHLLFFRSCRCKNTLAISIDFQPALKQIKKVDEFGKQPNLVKEMQDLFLSEIALWKANLSQQQKQTAFILNTDDPILLSKIFGGHMPTMQEDALGRYYLMPLAFLGNRRLYISHSAEEFLKVWDKSIQENLLLVCGIFVLDKIDIQEYASLRDKISLQDPFFQTITYSKKVTSVHEFGFDDPYHNCFKANDESLPFMLINRWNRYFYLKQTSAR